MEPGLKEQALFSGQFKGKCRNCGLIGHKSFQCKNRAVNNGGNNGNTSGGIFCSYCRKSGHDKRNCFKLKKKEARNNSSSSNNGNGNRQNYESQDVVFTATSKNGTLSDDIWICDSGACGHYCKSIEGMFNLKDIAETITVGNGDSMMATKVGSLKRRVVQLDGSTLDIIINEVKYVPNLCANLFSINKAIKNGFNLSNNGTSICLTKGSASITFDRVINTLSGSISGIKMVCKESSVAYTAQGKTESINSIDINKFHEMIGHCGSDRLKRTAAIHGLRLKGDLKICEDCAVAKARQKNVNQDWKEGSRTPGERVYLDISSIKNKSYGGSRFWVLIVDDYTDYCWSIFLKAKSDLKAKVTTLLTDLKIAGVNVKFIRCDDSGENKALFEECHSKGYGIKFEFSGPRTPQRNGKVERKFQTFFGRIRAMLNSAGLKDNLRSGVWAECAMTVTFLSNITSIKNQEICPYQLLYGCKPRLPASLRSFGEMGIVTTKDKIQSKLNNRGMPCMFVGYSVHHAHDVYRMLNIESEIIINSRDIIWLKEMHKDWIGRKAKNQLVDDDEDTDIMESKNQLFKEGQEASLAVTNQVDLKRMKLYRQLRQLESSFNPDAAKLVEQIEQGKEIMLDQINLAFFSGIVFNEEPTTFEQAWNHQDPKIREKWRDAINKEFDEMSKKEVWKVIKKEDIPKNRRTIKCKWIFKIKRNGIFRARLVACGYSQIPGIDFNESFAPVINDVSFRIMLIAKLIWNLKGCIIDVETAFLHGELKEEIYMNIPEGMNIDSNNCLLLTKTIYGLVQSAREFYKKLISVLKLIGFKENKSDPCLLSRWNQDGILLIGIYVDDCLVVGKERDIDHLIVALKENGFNLKIENNLTDYLSCRVIEDVKLNQILILQPHLINNLQAKFGDEVANKRVYQTPGTPRFKIVRPDDDADIIDPKLQSRYRSGVGMLLYLTKHSRPDLCNVVRELSKCMDKATMGTYLEMLRVIKFVIDTQQFCLKIQPKPELKNWSLHVFCDSDWAGDSETRISVTGFIVYLMNVPVCWRSKAQRGVTLSSSEAEYVAISEAVKEIKFIYYLLQGIGIEIDLPIVVKTDNIGAMFMAQNASSGVRTRHVDTRYHYVRENLEDGIIKIEFVRSDENHSDIFTKNVNQEIYQKHVKNFLEDSGEEYGN